MGKPTGEIMLMHNVPLSATYEHTFDFQNAQQQYNYWRTYAKHTLTDYTYIRQEREYIVVGLTMQQLDDVNYMAFRSETDGRLYYAFVTQKTFMNPNSTRVFFEIDVMQSYMFDYKWRASYIKQAHVDRWTAEHKPIYSKTDEGLNYGSEYAVESAHALRQSEKVRWFLVAMKDYSAVLDSGASIQSTDAFGLSAPFAFLLIPAICSDESPLNVHMVYVRGEGISEFSRIGHMDAFSNNMLLHGIGDYVQSISMLSYNPFVESETIEQNGNIFNYNIVLESNNAAYGLVGFKGAASYFLGIRKASSAQLRGILAQAEWNIGLEDSLPTQAQWDEIKQKPYTMKKDKRFESKLLCAPYRYNLLTDWKNDPVVFKNEYMTNDTIEVDYVTALTPNAPFRYWIKDYKKDPEGRYTSLFCLMSTDMPIINDAYSTYMLQNKNTIQANLTNAIVSSTTNVITGTVGGAISGGGMGGIGGAIYGAATGFAANAISGVVNTTNMLRSENAKQNDLKAKPDTVMGSSDSVFNFNDNNTEVTFYRMRICCENEEILHEIFNMSGYKVHRVDVPNTHSRTRFNYIQTVGANIIGSFNQADLLKIKSIYDNGITIWHYTDKIAAANAFNPFDYSYENIEVNLI